VIMFIAPESYLNIPPPIGDPWQPKHLVRAVSPVADIEPTKKYGSKDPVKGGNIDIIV